MPPVGSSRGPGEGPDPIAQLRHDLLTPLNTLLGGLDLLLKTALGDQQRKYAEMCKRSAEALLRMATALHERFPQLDVSEGVSSRAPKDALAASLAAAGAGVLMKPVTRAQLLEAIDNATESRQRDDPRLRILLAEDFSDSRTLCGQYLRTTGHQLDVVNDGRSAVDAVAAGHYDLILMDVDMPVVDGMTAIREIRAWERQHGRTPTPIIALTAYELTPAAPPPTSPGNPPEIVLQPDAEIAHLIPEFLASRRKDVRTILDALDEGEFDRIRTLGHSLKGAGGAYGFDGISQLGKRLEDAAVRRDVDEIRRSAAALAGYLDRVRTVGGESPA